MFENKYYQFFDDQGRPTKREVVFKGGIHNPTMDMVWQGWLCGREMDPPKVADSEGSYTEYLMRKNAGEMADKADAIKLAAYKEAMKAGPKKAKGQNYQPGE